LNRNKERAVLDLKRLDGLELVLRMAERADLVMENFRPGVAAWLGLGYEALRAKRRGLIYGSVFGFGQDGEDRERPGYDLGERADVYEFGEGFVSGGGCAGGVVFCSKECWRLWCGEERRARVAYVDVSLLDDVLAATSLIAGIDPKPAGAAHANTVPYQVFLCGEGQVSVG
jgi:crotonobetainyl-CoA:carnitine CoA-transferase CaiB-like acyl-CoA transferase